MLLFIRGYGPPLTLRRSSRVCSATTTSYQHGYLSVERTVRRNLSGPGKISSEDNSMCHFPSDFHKEMKTLEKDLFVEQDAFLEAQEQQLKVGVFESSSLTVAAQFFSC
ncbi:hypothetical protein RB195_017548 [Necator americanus]|uniref:Uncharacterized protein n=1 Tax=Necator americanus TaxID=51031 RepID=A0ABR1C5R4_NECAM